MDWTYILTELNIVLSPKMDRLVTFPRCSVLVARSPPAALTEVRRSSSILDIAGQAFLFARSALLFASVAIDQPYLLDGFWAVSELRCARPEV